MAVKKRKAVKKAAPKRKAAKKAAPRRKAAKKAAPTVIETIMGVMGAHPHSAHHAPKKAAKRRMKVRRVAKAKISIKKFFILKFLYKCLRYYARFFYINLLVLINFNRSFLI